MRKYHAQLVDAHARYLGKVAKGEWKEVDTVVKSEKKSKKKKSVVTVDTVTEVDMNVSRCRFNEVLKELLHAQQSSSAVDQETEQLDLKDGSKLSTLNIPNDEAMVGCVGPTALPLCANGAVTSQILKIPEQSLPISGTADSSIPIPLERNPFYIPEFLVEQVLKNFLLWLIYRDQRVS